MNGACPLMWWAGPREGRGNGLEPAPLVGRLQLRAVQELCRGNYDSIKVSFHNGPSELLNSQRWKIIYSGSFCSVAILRNRWAEGRQGELINV